VFTFRWIFIVCPPSAKIAKSASRPVNSISWPCIAVTLTLTLTLLIIALIITRDPNPVMLGSYRLPVTSVCRIECIDILIQHLHSDITACCCCCSCCCCNSAGNEGRSRQMHHCLHKSSRYSAKTHTQPFYCSSGICPGPPG